MNEPSSEFEFFEDIKALILSARQRAATAVNVELTLLYWRVGRRVAKEVLKGERAAYGKQVIAMLADDLTTTYGRGWSKRNLAQMVKFAELFPSETIVQTLSAQLSWSHFVSLVAIKDELKREFYITMAVEGRWSTRTLNERVDSQLFERTAISKKPEQTINSEIDALREQKERSLYSLALIIHSDTYRR